MIDSTRKTYFAPDDDAATPLLNIVKAANKKVRVMDYSYNLPALTDTLIQLHQAGKDVALVLDRSQSAGSSEVPELAKLEAAGVPFVTGTSDKHRIMHNKVIIIDDQITISGSYNFTVLAALEDNFMDIEVSSERAAAFTTVFETIRDWMIAHDPQDSAHATVKA